MLKDWLPYVKTQAMIDIHDKSLDLKIIAHLICKKDLLAID